MQIPADYNNNRININIVKMYLTTNFTQQNKLII